MKLTRTFASAAVALAATAGVIGLSATGASAASGYEDTFSKSRCTSSGACTALGAGVDYDGARSVRLKAVVKDAPGDSSCTVVKARIYSRTGAQIGKTVTVGSACDGRTVTLAAKRISTSTSEIARVKVYSQVGTSSTTTVISDNCYRSSDSYKGTPDSCR